MLKVSIITASYQAAGTIAQAVSSVAAQDYPEIEHILVDGASKDDTVRVAQSVEKHRLTQVLSEPDRGMYDAMNKGLRLAQGDIIGILNADDALAHPQVISRIVNTISAGAEGCYGDLNLVNSAGKLVRHWKSAPYNARALMHGWAPPHPTLYVRRSVYEAVGPFDTRYRIAADMDMMFRILAVHKARVSYIPEVLVTMQAGGASNGSLRGIWRANCETYQSLRALGLPVSAFYIPMKLARKVAQHFVRS